MSITIRSALAILSVVLASTSTPTVEGLSIKGSCCQDLCPCMIRVQKELNGDSAMTAQVDNNIRDDIPLQRSSGSVDVIASIMDNTESTIDIGTHSIPEIKSLKTFGNVFTTLEVPEASVAERTLD
ncbi:uncharacterized protein LOC111261672 isoform X2 [Varroa jacobsoni]|uniref:uncharacterized protein LOC111261672 isoform X2 n=1 Tax=Varroa jacobsoni TaxID=62625 RepID=UPI000BF6FB0D|nr:uncharacterized protein LOC111261672 isoform X2 [Varroa jacobsoni]